MIIMYFGKGMIKLNLAEQMYEKACKNRINQLPTEIHSEIENAVEQGYFYCQIDNKELVLRNKELLEDLGFSVEYDTDYEFGQVPTQYIIISWEVDN